MRDFVYVNGEIVPSEQAKISVYDHGFLYGDGLFETMRSYRGKVFRLEQHLKRMAKAANILGIKVPLSTELADGIRNTIKWNSLENKDAYIRLTLTRGDGPMGIDPGLCNKPNIIIMLKEINTNQNVYTKGIDAVIVKTIRNSIESTDPRLKTMNFLNNIMAKMEVKNSGAAEGIFLNQKGEVAEATVSNLFIVKNGIIKTPPIEAGILPGITRQLIMEITGDILVVEEKLYPEDLYNADEIFLTNSISEIIPVIRIDGKIISSGIPGEVTKKLHAIYIVQTSL